MRDSGGRRRSAKKRGGKGARSEEVTPAQQGRKEREAHKPHANLKYFKETDTIYVKFQFNIWYIFLLKNTN